MCAFYDERFSTIYTEKKKFLVLKISLISTRFHGNLETMRYFQNKKFIFSLNDANNRRNKTDNAG